MASLKTALLFSAFHSISLYAQPTISLRFVSPDDTSITIISILDTRSSFIAVITTSTPTPNQIDSIGLRLTTPQGDFETLYALETAPNSGRFTVTVPFQFDLPTPIPGNAWMDAQLNPSLAFNSMPVYAVVSRTPTDSATGMITLFSEYNPALRGTVRDRDGDGAADAAYLEFYRKLDRLPDSLGPIYWNQFGMNGRVAPGANLSLSPDSMTLIADLSGNPFPVGLTAIPAGGFPLYVDLPPDSYFGGRRVLWEDAVGPVPVSAIKFPSNLRPDAQGLYPPDTILIEVSEPLQVSLSSLADAFAFSMTSDCGDTNAVRHPIPLLAIYSSGGMYFTLYVSNAPGARVPLAGNCISLETSGRVTDGLGNLPGRLSVPLQGNDPIVILAIPANLSAVLKFPVKGFDIKGRHLKTINRSPKSRKKPKAVLIH